MHKKTFTRFFFLWMFAVVLNIPMLASVSDETEVLQEWVPAEVVSEEAVENFGIDSCFRIFPITDAVFDRIYKKSYKENCRQPRSTLRYLHVLHRNADGKTQLGELICHASIAQDLLDIFRELYLNGYKIERITLVDDYDADDEKSMAANNTSCFNYRPIAGSTKLSKHSQGLAIDINPLYNPCQNTRTGKVQPAAGKVYATHRSSSKQTKCPLIDKDDLCYRLFIQHGFRWGGNWNTTKDYQHFEK
ncbi:MAG: M15 family metallopeptidase [Bacteroidaceae bacterium]|nr:M15 family metallopeptidase [Bacteroidaceae bacterium]